MGAGVLGSLRGVAEEVTNGGNSVPAPIVCLSGFGNDWLHFFRSLGPGLPCSLDIFKTSAGSINRFFLKKAEKRLRIVASGTGQNASRRDI